MAGGSPASVVVSLLISSLDEGVWNTLEALQSAEGGDPAYQDHLRLQLEMVITDWWELRRLLRQEFAASKVGGESAGKETDHDHAGD